MSSDKPWQWIGDDAWKAAAARPFPEPSPSIAEILVVAEANLIVALESYRAATEADRGW